MLTFVDEVVSAVDGSRVRAHVAQCAECGGLVFGAFQLDGQDHFHLQCVACNTSYCPEGGCGRGAEGGEHGG